MLLLASASPRRAEILKTFNIPFKVVPNRFHEPPFISTPKTRRYRLRQRALKKAQASQSGHKDVILTADTIVIAPNQTVLEKPKTLQEAIKMITLLSGATHTVMTACCVYDPVHQNGRTRSVVTSVTFNPLSLAKITAYCHEKKPLDKAGGYGIQELPKSFINHIRGCYYNVMGLPIYTVKKLLKS